MRQLIFIVLVILISFAISPQAAVHAQANLLTNPGFEPPYDVVQRGLPNGWSGQTVEGTPDFYQEQYGSLYSGSRSQAIVCSGVCKAAIYQVVSGVPVGSKIRASGYASLYLAAPGSTVEQLIGTFSHIQIAIDPNGGTNINDSDIIWGSFINTQNGRQVGEFGWTVDYTNLGIEAVTTGPNVTLFFYVKQTWPALEHRLFFDNASLTIVEAGTGTTNTGTTGGAVAPTSPPPVVSSFAQPQEAQADGSIIHTVRANETVYAIAVVYGVTAQQILELNDIGDGRFIYEGQKLRIRAATSTTTNTNTTADDDDPTAAPTTQATQVASQATKVPASATPAPTNTSVPSATPVPPTSTPLPDAPVVTQDSNEAQLGGATSVCVAMFEDTNMNRIMEGGENYLAGGMITLSQNGNNVETVVTDTSDDPICFDGLDVGEYVVIGSAPAGYGLTTPDQLRLRVRPGSPLEVMFGAAQGVEVAVAPPANVDPLTPATADAASAEEDDAKLLQYLGLIVFGLAGLSLVGGLGIALIMRRG